MGVTFDKLLSKPLLHKHKVGDITGLSSGNVPEGGTTNQVLAKASNTNFDTGWVDQSGGAVDSVNGETGTVVLDADDIDDTSTTNKFATSTELSKLAGIADGANVNNISDINATDLTDAGDTILHYHSSDRDRTNHTGTQLLSTISDAGTAAEINIHIGTTAPESPSENDIWVDIS